MEDYEDDSPEPRRAGDTAADDDAAVPAVRAQLSDGQLSVLNDYDAPLDEHDDVNNNSNNNGGVVVEEVDDDDSGEPLSGATLATAPKKGGAPVPALLLRVVRAAAADAAWCESPP